MLGYTSHCMLGPHFPRTDKNKEVRGLQTRLRLTPTNFHQRYKVLRIAISCTGKFLLSRFCQVHLCHLKNHWNHFHTPIYHSRCACFCGQTSLVSNTTQEIIPLINIHDIRVLKKCDDNHSALYLFKTKTHQSNSRTWLNRHTLDSRNLLYNEHLNNLDCPSIHFNT